MNPIPKPYHPTDEVEFRYTPSTPTTAVSPALCVSALLLACVGALSASQITNLDLAASVGAVAVLPLLAILTVLGRRLARVDRDERDELAQWLRTQHDLELGGPVTHVTSLFDGRPRRGIYEGVSGTVRLNKLPDGTHFVRWDTNHYPPRNDVS